MFPLKVFWSLVSIVSAASLSSVPALAGENQITSDETHSSSVRLQTGASASTNGSPLAKSALRQNMIETLPAIDASGQLLELLNGNLPDGPCEFTVLIDYDGEMNRLHFRKAVGLTQRSARYNAVASVLNGFVPSQKLKLWFASGGYLRLTASGYCCSLGPVDHSGRKLAIPVFLIRKHLCNA